MANVPADGKRFEIVITDRFGLLETSQVLRDRETGVLYLFHQAGYAGGLTLLVDRDGRPMTQGYGQR